MRLHLKRSGGFANIALQGTIEVDSLPPDLASQVKSCFGSGRLAPAGGDDSGAFCDAQQYDIQVVEGSNVRRFLIDESTADSELADLCNRLVSEIVQQKRT